eukprot:Amastigsp_a175094_15.p4 type:complete len:142 gc:universal Amastigsp_a175094_15:451-876(+)
MGTRTRARTTSPRASPASRRKPMSSQAPSTTRSSSTWCSTRCTRAHAGRGLSSRASPQRVGRRTAVSAWARWSATASLPTAPRRCSSSGCCSRPMSSRSTCAASAASSATPAGASSAALPTPSPRSTFPTPPSSSSKSSRA